MPSSLPLSSGSTRAVAFAALRGDVAGDDDAALVALAKQLTIEVGNDRVLLDGQDVTQAIRTVAVTAATHFAANNRAGGWRNLTRTD